MRPGEWRPGLAAVRAEWTKLRTLPSTAGLLAGAAGLTIAAGALIAVSTHVTAGAPGSAPHDPTKLALTGIALGQAVIAVLAVTVVGEEYATGMVHVTLMAIPRRSRLLVAKAINLSGLVAIAGLVAVAGCLAIGRELLPVAGLDPAHGDALVSLADASTRRAAAGSVLYLVLVGWLALAIATLVRDTAASIGAVLALLYLPPLLAEAVGEPLRRHLEQLAPMTAGLAIQVTIDRGAQPIGPWAGLGVLAAWSACGLLVAGVALELRDA